MAQTYTVISPTDVALKPPPGAVPDFQDPYTLRPYWNVTISLALISSGVILVLRLYTKIAVVKSCRWEDYTCALGFVFFIVQVGLAFQVVNAKLGTHQWNITSEDLARQNQFTNYANMFYSPAVGLIKISIILLVLRIFCPLKRDPFYWILQSLNVLNTIFYTIFFFIPIFQCSPRKKIWLPETQGKCLDIYGLYISSAAFNVMSDLAMYFVPLWKVWHLQMSRGRKYALSAIFATGSLAIVSSICRLIFDILSIHSDDLSYKGMQSSCFANSEIACGIICSCLFVLPRLYRHLVSSPPYDSDEYRLRKYKQITSSPVNKTPLDEPRLRKFHREGEQRNPWERDIETAAVLPKTFPSRE